MLATFIGAGALAFWFMRSHKLATSQGPILDTMPELAWLRMELKLTPEQFTEVSSLHVAYRPKCMEMCHRISEAHEKIEVLARGGRKMSPELEQAIREHSKIHAESQEAMLKHLYETAAVLEANQANCYLDTMLPFALDFTLSEPGTLHSR